MTAAADSAIAANNRIPTATCNHSQSILAKSCPFKAGASGECVSRAAIKTRNQQLKEELGLDHFEGRSWRGLHRHALMAMTAYAFLQHLRLAAKSGGKKKSRPARLNRRCRPYEKPSSSPWPALRPTDAHTAAGKYADRRDRPRVFRHRRADRRRRRNKLAENHAAKEC